MSLIRKHGAVLQAWACLDLVRQRLYRPILFSRVAILETNNGVEDCITASL